MVDQYFPEFSVKTDIDRITRGLTETQQEQIPFAVSRAMWQTTSVAKDRGQVSMRQALNQPRNRTVEAMRNWAPGKNSVFRRSAKVFFPRYLAQELGLQVYGGTVDRISDEDRTIITPVNATLDAWGNVEGFRGRRNILRRARELENELGVEFVEVPLGQEDRYHGLPAGLYERVDGDLNAEFGRLLVMLFAYDEERTYKRIWEFDSVVIDVYSRQFPFIFSKELARLIDRRFSRNGQVFE